MFKNRTGIDKTYLALVCGKISKEGVINKPLTKDENDKTVRVDSKYGKTAITEYKPLVFSDDFTLVEAHILTGRTHQIRVHMKYIGHPIVGDDVYGKEDKKFGLKGQLLHSKSIGFIQPTTKEYMEFDSELPDYFKKVLEKLDNAEWLNEI